ncbi:MAG: alcohol dehydrogenase catalytic domain-containing protein [Planctomycetaceae bacterium]|nr:alcohol dehydrogenase catalytic domain-containing protein [Planctomycetaceae bacterium]
MEIPKKQRAVQLTGPNQLVYNTEKEVFMPNDYQILGKVEAVGLCFSDLKLLKQFSAHPRKSPILSGIDQKILKEIPSYVPDDMPTVPGHEVVIRIAAVGGKVKDVKPGQRFLVQTDYRWLPTKNSNAAFGYNFEGALQEYVLMDERVIISPTDGSMLLPASDKLSASAIALVEPWACVEDAYSIKERQTLKTEGKTLVVSDVDYSEKTLKDFLRKFGNPSSVMYASKDEIAKLKEADFDDVIYFGSNAETIEKIFPKLSAGSLLNVVLCGGKIARKITCKIGRVHYGNIRIVGTSSNNPADSMGYIPAGGEIKKGDKINVVGAGGPMGVMHVVRNLCQGVKNVSVYGADLDDNRLHILNRIAKPLADKNDLKFIPYNSTKNNITEKFDYIILMAPVPKLVELSVDSAADNAKINIFAGIPATVDGMVDLQTYIDKKLYFIGTSGSTLDDMKTVLAKVEQGSLDTNISIAAVAGLSAAIEGVNAVENQLIPGKIVVYPAAKNLPLTKIEQIKNSMPDVAEKLHNGLWSKEAEDALLKKLS